MSKIIGYGAIKPSNLVTNDDLTKCFETSDEWIRTRTGIHTRNIHNGMNIDLALEASISALKDANCKAEDIDYIICANIAPDDAVVSTAASVMGALNATGTPCIDINAACSSFLYGLDFADALLKTRKNVNKVLLISSEMVTRLTDFTDRSSAILFGDAAGAVVIEKSDIDGIQNISIGAKPSESGVLDSPLKYIENPFRETVEQKGSIRMDGQKVFKFAVSTVSKEIIKLLEDSNLTLDDIKYIVPHQANVRIIESIAKKVGTDMDKFYINLERWGNTSSATIPVALKELKEEGKIKPGDKLVLAGFGAGLTWGTCLIEV